MDVTVKLPQELVEQAKSYAAEHDTSIDALVCGLLEETVTQRARSRGAGRRFLELTEQGPFVDMDISSIRREDLYER